MDLDLKILDWNPRGLNNPARRAAIRGVVERSTCDIICFQETKLSDASDAIRAESVGNRCHSAFASPADGTRGGLLVAWDPDRYDAQLIGSAHNSITAAFTSRAGGPAWTLTNVYGPSDTDVAKEAFLHDLQELRHSVVGPWLIVGDFNVILSAADKNNDRLNRRLMAKFRAMLNITEMKDIKLVGRRFTWSNEQNPPTLVRLDRAICNVDWDASFPNAQLTAISSSILDHCPLVLSCAGKIKRYSGFRFEAFWPHVEGYAQTVADAWVQPCNHFNALT
jgi:exonuclease III